MTPCPRKHHVVRLVSDGITIYVRSVAVILFKRLLRMKNGDKVSSCHGGSKLVQWYVSYGRKRSGYGLQPDPSRALGVSFVHSSSPDVGQESVVTSARLYPQHTPVSSGICLW